MKRESPCLCLCLPQTFPVGQASQPLPAAPGRVGRLGGQRAFLECVQGMHCDR